MLAVAWKCSTSPLARHIQKLAIKTEKCNQQQNAMLNPQQQWQHVVDGGREGGAIGEVMHIKYFDIWVAFMLS